MKFKNKKLLIFDLDGTLIDSVPDLAASVNYTINKLYQKTYSVDTIRKWVGNGASTLIKRALSNNVKVNNSLNIDDIQIALDIFLDHYSKNICLKTNMYNEVENTLKILKNNGYILTIVTNKPYEFIEPILTKLNINNLFSYYIGANSLDEKKPSAKPLIHVCNKLNIKIENSIMIGDSRNDIIAASNALMDSIALTYGYNYDEDISIYNPTIIYNKFEDILKSL